MFRVAVILLLTAISQQLMAQTKTDCEAISASFYAYSKCIESKDYDKAFTYYLDSFLLYIPKEQLRKLFEDANSSDKIMYLVADSEIDALTEIIEDDRETKYAFLKYTSTCYYVFSQEADKEYRERIKKMFKEKHPNSYSFNARNQSISFKKESELIALKKVSDEWKFIIYKDVMIPYMHLWMPESTFSKLYVLRKQMEPSKHSCDQLLD